MCRSNRIPVRGPPATKRYRASPAWERGNASSSSGRTRRCLVFNAGKRHRLIFPRGARQGDASISMILVAKINP
ncbi:hypothetical protein BHM03_00029879 [Ensete ventricosum]|nr:hypothetical protein BHM03_00029879 [Ensete ventricosum]